MKLSFGTVNISLSKMSVIPVPETVEFIWYLTYLPFFPDKLMTITCFGNFIFHKT